MKTPKLTKANVSIFLIVIGCIFGLAAVGLLVWQRHARQASMDELEAMRESAASIQEANESLTADPTPDPTDTPSPTVTPSPTPTPIPLVENPYRDSFLANEDMAGWLQIPDTNIDYPIMWTPEDENYYLRRGFDGSRDSSGCLILDTDSYVDPLSTNLIIHGHNMRSGAMFGHLMDYEDPEYGQEHNRIILYTESVQRNYEVLAVFRSQVYFKTDQVFKFYQFFQADTEEEFQNFYQNIKELSLYDTGVTAEYGDHFITLSTCAYHVEQGRFVVVAKEVEHGDEYLPFRQEDETAVE